MELLPEEALYLLERGTLQIWCHPSAYDPSVPASEDLVWDDARAGFDGCVEMSAMEAFSRFIGRDGLTLERYQVRVFFSQGFPFQARCGRLMVLVGICRAKAAGLYRSTDGAVLTRALS